jgi:endonuclease-3
MPAKKPSPAAPRRRSPASADLGAVVAPKPRPQSKAVQAARAKKRTPRAVDKATIDAIFTRFHAVQPEPKGELEYVNPFTLLVAVVLSAQATDVGVNKATRPLFAIADTPAKMLALGEDKVREYVKTIGLFRTKAKNVVELSRQLIERFGGQVPQDRDALVSLPGVGRKTANVVLNMAFGMETMAVDTHIFRVSNRLKLAPGRTPEEVEAGLEKNVPKRFRLHAHHWLILHGRYTCKALRPECERCIVNDLCKSPDKRV